MVYVRGYALTLIGIVFLGLAPFTHADNGSYQYAIDGHNYDLEYEFGGDVLTMNVDQELRSFLIGIKDADDRTFVIKIPKEMISATNEDFVILVDGMEVEYDIKSSKDLNEFAIPVFGGTQEIEIIGTSVIPEFPVGVLVILGATVSSIIILTRNQQLFR